MTLDREDIEAIAAAVVRRMKSAESMTMDIEFEMTLTPAERKARARAMMKAEDQQRKGGLACRNTNAAH